jgi:heptosyltransferase-3
MRRVLVLRGGALGDFIVTLPALAALRAHWPAARIELAGNAAAAALALHRGLIDAAHPQHGAQWAGLYGEGPLPPAFEAWLAEFDLIVNFWPDPDGDLGRRFPLRASQRYLSAPAWPAVAPAARHYLDALAPLGVGAGQLHFALSPQTGVSPPPGPTAPIVIHPGSGSPKKNWPADRWREVIRELGQPVVLVLGEAEASTWPDLPAEAIAWRNCELETLIAGLAGGGLFLGHDSGIGHLAAACGRTCVLLFGPTEPAMWAPPSPRGTVLRGGGQLADLGVPEVLAAVRAKLSDPI